VHKPGAGLHGRALGAMRHSPRVVWMTRTAAASSRSAVVDPSPAHAGCGDEPGAEIPHPARLTGGPTGASGSSSGSAAGPSRGRPLRLPGGGGGRLVAERESCDGVEAAACGGRSVWRLRHVLVGDEVGAGHGAGCRAG